MSGFPPDIEGFLDCATDAHRARWLQTASISTLRDHEMTLRRTLRKSGFHVGLGFLDAVLADDRAPRRDNGRSFDQMTVDVWRGRLSRISLGLSTVGMG